MSVVEDFFNTVFIRYAPADSFDRADLFLTTGQIQERIEDHTGAMVEGAEVYAFLTQEGYKCDSLEDLRFYWLFRDLDS